MGGDDWAFRDVTPKSKLSHERRRPAAPCNRNCPCRFSPGRMTAGASHAPHSPGELGNVRQMKRKNRPLHLLQRNGRTNIRSSNTSLPRILDVWSGILQFGQLQDDGRGEVEFIMVRLISTSD